MKIKLLLLGTVLVLGTGHLAKGQNSTEQALLQIEEKDANAKTEAIDEEELEITSPWNLGADFVSTYIWRGINYSANSMAIQPYGSYSKWGFEIGAWGSYAVGGDATFSELDLYLNYTTPNAVMSFGIVDYYYQTLRSEEFGGAFSVSNTGDYLNWNDTRTGHTLEAFVQFNGVKAFPISAMLATNFFGSDQNQEGDDNYSTYLELGYETEFKGVGINLFAGASLFSSIWYGVDQFSVINVGAGLSKEIRLSPKFGIDLSTNLIVNPAYDTVYLVFALGI